jgi:hypothetical protein
MDKTKEMKSIVLLLCLLVCAPCFAQTQTAPEPTADQATPPETNASPETNSSNNQAEAQSRYVTAAAQLLAQKGITPQNPTLFEQGLLKMGAGACQLINVGGTPQKVTEALKAISQKSGMDIETADAVGEVVVQSATETQLCAYVPVSSPTPTSPQETKYLAKTKQILEKKGLRIAESEDLDAAFLGTGRAICKLQAEGSQVNLKELTVMTAEKLGYSQKLMSQMMEAETKAARKELCPKVKL